MACIIASLFATSGGSTLMQRGAAQENNLAESNAPAAQFCNTTPISITGSLGEGKATPYPSNITVSNLSGVISNVSVKLNSIQHPWARDIDILLVGPHGEKFVVMSDVGWSRGFDSSATITLGDAGVTYLTDQADPIPSGTYKPTNHSDSFTTPDAFDAPAPIGPFNHPSPTGSATFASVFKNIDPNGTWSLYVMDDSSSNEGSIAGGWCLDITTGALPPNQIQFSSSNFNGDADTTATVTVNRVNPAPGAVAVNYATSNGSATGGASCGAGVDYIPASGTLNFADGETSKTFTVKLCSDAALEPNETINLTLSNPTGGAGLGIPGSATLNVIPPGAPAVQFCNTNTINIPISGSFPNPYPSTINVSGVTGVVSKVTVTLNNIQHFWASDLDILLVSPGGRKFVLMSDIGGADGFDNPTTITLADAATTDLLNVGLQIDSGAYKPTNLGSSDSFVSPAPTAPYNEPAPAGNSTLASAFNNTNPNGTWKLFVADDSSGAGGNIGGWCLDIVASTPLPDAVQFSASNYDRGANTTANVTVNRVNTSVGAVAVDYATSNGAATGGTSCGDGVDYISTSGTLNFADGEASKNISVQLCPGEASEQPESFNLTLSNPTGGAGLGTPGAATVTIYNGELPCNITWSKADSPHVISGVRTIFADQIVCVEPGVSVQFEADSQIDLYGQIRANGTAAERIRFTGENVFPNRIEVAGTMDARFADISVPLNINQGGSLFVRDSNFYQGGAIISFSGIVFERKPRFVSLENVVFDSNAPVQGDNAGIFATSFYLLMKNVAFKNSAYFNISSSTIKFENVVSQNSAYEGFTFSQGGMQPTLLENLSVTNCVRAGFALESGNFLFGDNIAIQNCEYPVSGKGGLMPGSVLPLTGNRNNWIEVGQPGGSAIYANVGLPYVVQGFADIGGIDFLPGVTVKARPSFDFYNEFSPSRILGLPNAPVTFEPFDPSQKWDGGQFNFNGNRLDYVVLDGMVSGVISSGGTGGNYYIDNSIIRNSTIGVIDRSDSAGVAHLQTNLFTNNESAIVERDSRIDTRQRTNPNLFENNATAVLSTGVPDVRYNWWNSPTGPTTPANPGGNGDRINGGARFQPFVTTRPDTTDRPPVVRMPRAPYAETGLLDAGKKILLHWDASDDRGIVKQKILFSRESLLRTSFTIIADDLPPSQRSFEFTVPSVGFVQSSSEQFIRIVAVDEKGQEGFDDWMPLIPAGDPRGELIITSDVAGRTFRGGDEIPFTTQTTVGFDECSMSNYLIFDADRRIVSLGVSTTIIMPPISTDTARLMRVCSRTYNQQKYFFSEPFSIRYDPRFPDAAPQVTLASPTAGQQFVAGDVVPVQWTATDDEAIRHFNIQSSSDNGRTWIQIAEQLPPTTTSYNWEPFVRGNLSDVRIRVIAVDRRFQNSSSTRSINFVAPQNTPPTVQVTFPANGATYTVGQSTFIAADASDPDGEIQRVEFYAKSGSPVSDPAFIGSDTTAPYQVPWVYPLAQGYIITARAFDNRNQMTTSAPINVTFNPFNPAPLPIARPELTNPVDGATYDAPANITLEALPAPTHRIIVRVEFYNGTTLVGTDTTAPYSVTLNDVPAGSYTFFVKSIADNNAESVSPLSDVTVREGSNQPPPVQITSPTNGTSFNQPASITIAVDATDADGTVAKVDFYQGTTLLGTDTAAPFECLWNAAAAGEYSLTAVATDNHGASTTSAAVAVTVADHNGGTLAGLQYYPLAHPVRLLDTRPGETACFTPGTALAANSTLALLATRTCDGLSIPTSAKAVVGNATVVNVSPSPGHITLFPSDATLPTVSNLNYVAGQIVPNAFTTGLGADGSFKVYTSTTTHFIVDVTGYYAPPGAGGLYYHPLPYPLRILDTRIGETACDAPGAPLQAGAARTQLARMACDGVVIPDDAQAIVGNATVVNISSTPGFITLHPSGTARPVASNLNFVAGQIVPNAFTVGLGASDGAFQIYAGTNTHFIVDVTGYYSSTPAPDANGVAGLLYYPLSTPVRLLDTRAGEVACSTPGTPITGSTARTQPARMTCGGVTIPASAQAIVGNATVVNISSTPGFITLHPSGTARPVASNLNFVAGQIVPNAFTVGLGTGDGGFEIYAGTTTHFIADVTGYFAP